MDNSLTLKEFKQFIFNCKDGFIFGRNKEYYKKLSMLGSDNIKELTRNARSNHLKRL